MNNDQWHYIKKSNQRVKIIQTNAVTYVVQDEEGNKFNVLHKELDMTHEQSYNDCAKAPNDLRRRDLPIVTTEVIPESTTVYVKGKGIQHYSDLELFKVIASIEDEILDLDRLRNKPLALTKLMDEKQRSIDTIINWMNARNEHTI